MNDLYIIIVDYSISNRFNIQPNISDVMSLWSEEECRNFENGLRAHGKDFFLNQQKASQVRKYEVIPILILKKVRLMID